MSLRAVFQTIVGWAQALSEKAPPLLKGSQNDAYLKTVLRRLAEFAVAGDGKDGKVRGAAAVEQRFSALVDSSAADKATSAEVADVRMFSWLLSEKQQQELKKIIDGCVAKGMKRQAGEHEQQEVAKRRSRKSGAQDVRTSVAAFFC